MTNRTKKNKKINNSRTRKAGGLWEITKNALRKKKKGTQATKLETEKEDHAKELHQLLRKDSDIRREEEKKRIELEDKEREEEQRREDNEKYEPYWNTILRNIKQYRNDAVKLTEERDELQAKYNKFSDRVENLFEKRDDSNILTRIKKRFKKPQTVPMNEDDDEDKIAGEIAIEKLTKPDKDYKTKRDMIIKLMRGEQVKISPLRPDLKDTLKYYKDSIAIESKLDELNKTINEMYATFTKIKEIFVTRDYESLNMFVELCKAPNVVYYTQEIEKGLQKENNDDFIKERNRVFNKILEKKGAYIPYNYKIAIRCISYHKNFDEDIKNLLGNEIFDILLLDDAQRDRRYTDEDISDMKERIKLKRKRSKIADLMGDDKATEHISDEEGGSVLKVSVDEIPSSPKKRRGMRIDPALFRRIQPDEVATRTRTETGPVKTVNMDDFLGEEQSTGLTGGGNKSFTDRDMINIKGIFKGGSHKRHKIRLHIAGLL